LRFFVGLVSSILLAAPAVTAQSNVCDKLIPPTGAFRTVSQGGSTQVFDSAKAWFCSDSFLTSASSGKTSGGIVVPIDGIPLGANFDTNNKKDLTARQNFCGSNQRDFSSDQNDFLYIHEGDPTLVAGFVACIKTIATTQGLLQVDTESHASGTFDIKIGCKGYPGGPPTIRGVDIESGATGLLLTQFKPGTRIPFVTDGKTPIVGSFAFQPNAPEAIILVRTSIGDQTIVADRCPSGAAGTWRLIKDVPHATVVPAPQFSTSFEVPQAGCQPNCGGGDQISHQFSAPAGETFANPRITCEAGRPECPLDPESVRLLDDHTLEADVVTRTLGLLFTVTADTYTTQNITSRDVVLNGAISYGSSFSVTVPNDGNPTLEINTSLGNPIYTTADLAGGKLAPWIQLDPPSNTPNGTIFTMTVSAPSCAVSH
jgi:hypothetical protein